MASPSIDYERHEPEKTLLHEVVREQLESFLGRSSRDGAPVARFVEREIRAYLECGVLAHGFLRVHCDGCGHDRLVAFSRKRRGFCPSCGGRRMADTAAHLTDRVLPEVPERQWVLTLPYPLRYRCAWNAPLTTEVLRAFLRAVFADQRRRARKLFGIRKGSCGSVTFIQRFGSALNLTPHFHTLVLDGVYTGTSSAPGPFSPLPPPETEDVARVLAGTARRILRRFEGRGIAMDEDPLAADDPLMAMLGAASIRSQIATGPEAGEPWRRLGDRIEPAADEDEEASVEPGAAVPPRCVRHGGMSLHADVAVPAGDRRRLERLCRYVARPPLALERLQTMADGRLAYRLKTRWRDGTTHVVMERHELLERLAPLIPPSRAHQVRYHGVLAPCASGRDRIVPGRSRPDVPDAVLRQGEKTRPPIEARPEVLMNGADAGPEMGPALTVDQCSASASALRPSGSIDCDPVALGVAAGLKASVDFAEPPPRRTAWSELLQRVFEVDALHCPKCGGRMRILSAITDPTVASRILRCLRLPVRAPPLAAANEGARVSGRAGDEWLGEVPGFDFDQSRPTEDWESSA